MSFLEGMLLIKIVGYGICVEWSLIERKIMVVMFYYKLEIF